MASITTGTIDGFRLALVSDHLREHSLLTALDAETEAAVREVLNGALRDAARLLNARPAVAAAVARDARDPSAVVGPEAPRRSPRPR
jgi:hypothetical protein